MDGGEGVYLLFKCLQSAGLNKFLEVPDINVLNAEDIIIRYHQDPQVPLIQNHFTPLFFFPKETHEISVSKHLLWKTLASRE